MMTIYKEIDGLLRQQEFSDASDTPEVVYGYARGVAAIERSLVVVSDLKCGTSRIFHGGFSELLGLNPTTTENSIWEKEILGRLSPREVEEKYLAELRFFNFLRHIHRDRRRNFFLATQLRMVDTHGENIEVLHRMYYWFDSRSEAIRYGICVYAPSWFGLPAKSVVVDMLSGRWEELSSRADESILSARERQVLALIDKGLTTNDVADQLCISRNTVSRHRQSILSKLQARNSTEACRRAKQMKLI